MQPFEYLLIQLELEGIKRVSGGLIACLQQNADDCPLVISARTSDGESLVSFNESVSEEIRSALPKDDLKEFNTASSIEIFKQYGIQAEASHFKTYAFPNSFEFAKTETVKCLGRKDTKVIAFDFNGFTDKVYAIENEEMILSACVSSRQNHKATEAWVMTNPDHRKKGLARQVVVVWAEGMQQDGLIPFYSHNSKNTNSAMLAKSLKLIPIFEETVIELVS
ncbi:MAG TPA: GNAT family N-acetyltransferase [Anaerolineales bacterium]|nr:GNAT family N-acetyltransferase [Anaerolineales bacterium]